jgi:hypothetical protein
VSPRAIVSPFVDVDDDEALTPSRLGGDDGPSCRGCGCTALDACETPNGACFWLEPDLCSACAGDER